MSTIRQQPSELENALSRKSRCQYRLIWIQLFTLLTLAVVFGYTWLNFDDLYVPYRSAYPNLSTLFSPLNMVIITLLVVVNGFAIYQIRHAREQLAISAYVLLNKMDEPQQSSHPDWLNAFLAAAGLPADYSFVLLKKMKMRHFMTMSGAINKAVSEHKAAWIALSRQY